MLRVPISNLREPTHASVSFILHVSKSRKIYFAAEAVQVNGGNAWSQAGLLPAKFCELLEAYYLQFSNK